MDDSVHDFAFDLVKLLYRALVAFAPEVLTARRVEQFDRDEQSLIVPTRLP